MLLRIIRSFVSSIRASRSLGKVYRLSRSGRPHQALTEARNGLKFLSKPWVVRSNPAESSLLVCLVIELETISHECGEVGATEKDLVDAYLNICSLNSNGTSNTEYAEWLPYIEKKLGYTPHR